MENKQIDISVLDTELTVRSINSLRRLGIKTIKEIQDLGRDGFLKTSEFSYVVKLDILNYLHKNRLYFFDDK